MLNLNQPVPVEQKIEEIEKGLKPPFFKKSSNQKHLYLKVNKSEIKLYKIAEAPQIDLLTKLAIKKELLAELKEFEKWNIFEDCSSTTSFKIDIMDFEPVKQDMLFVGTNRSLLLY